MHECIPVILFKDLNVFTSLYLNYLFAARQSTTDGSVTDGETSSSAGHGGLETTAMNHGELTTHEEHTTQGAATNIYLSTGLLCLTTLIAALRNF